MTVLFRGPPTCGPVMNFSEKNLGQSLPGSRVPCSPASRMEPALQALHYAIPLVTSSAPANRVRAPLKRVRGAKRPSANQRRVPTERVHTGTWLGYAVHVSGTGELEHCCCVKCRCSGAARALLTPIKRGHGHPLRFALTVKILTKTKYIRLYLPAGRCQMKTNNCYI